MTSPLEDVVAGGSRLGRLPLFSTTAWLAAAAGALALTASPPPARAATFHAHDRASLQAAVQSADATPGANTIELSAGVYSPDSTLTLTGDVALAGPPAAPGAKLDGGTVQPFPSDMLVVESHARVTLRDLELTTAGGQGQGAAVDDFGVLDLESSTLAGNNGPGLLVQPGAQATVRDSTLSDGLDFGLVDLGSASLFSSTVAANANGGVDDSSGILDLTNTIVAGDGANAVFPGSAAHDCTRPAHTSDRSLDGDGSCGVGALSRTDPLLGPLVRNGGPTPTHALEPGSPAVAAGDPSACTLEDQRHYARPSGRCDIGAYQTDAAPSSAGGAPGAEPEKTAAKHGSSGPGRTRCRRHRRRCHKRHRRRHPHHRRHRRNRRRSRLASGPGARRADAATIATCSRFVTELYPFCKTPAA